jgi:hypothetical protein
VLLPDASPIALERFAGTPYEVGFAIGRSMRGRLAAGIDHYLQARPANPDALDADRLHAGALPWLRSLPARFRDELEGLAAGAGVPVQRVAEWSFVESCVRDGCSSLVETIDGHAWIARNNDMFVPGIWGHATVREIDGRIPTLTFGQEGDAFTATGVNRERLWLHHQALDVTDAPRPGRPHMSGWILLVEMLETCTTIDEVAACLADIDRDEGMLLFAVDGKTDETAVFECACGPFVRRAPVGGRIAGTNHAIALAPTAITAPPSADSRARLARMEALAHELEERADAPDLPSDLIAVIADPIVERRGPRIATVYATVACPATGDVWFTFGGEPAASAGRWARIAWPW